MKISNLVAATSPYLQVDAGLTTQRILGLAFELRELRSRDVTFLTSPTLGTGQAGSQSIVRPDWEGLAALSEALKNDTVLEFAAEYK